MPIFAVSSKKVKKVKGVDLTGLLGDIKEDWVSRDESPPVGSRGRAPVEGLGETTHNICIKIQQTTLQLLSLESTS